MTKPLHAGNAARNGVLASLLAAKGFTADPEVFTSLGGFADAYQLPREFSIEEVATNLRRRFLIAERGIRIKPYPSCSPTHHYIEAMRRLRSKYPLTAEAVESIACTPSKSLRCLYPKTDLECKFSAAFSLAATLIDGEVNLRNCTEAFLKRRDVQSLLAKTVYVNRPSGSGGFVRVKTTAGDLYEESLLPPRELPTYEEMRAKFYDCARTAIPQPRAQKIESLIQKLEELPSVHEICRLLQPQEKLGAIDKIN